jgi:ribose transport system ATP-binding protein
VSKVTPEQIVEGIVGKKMEGQLVYHARDDASTQGDPVLEARGLNAGPRVRDVSFTVHAGEILGLAGLMGSGRTELARALFGIDRLDSGEIYIRGKKADLSTPKRAMTAGLALIPEDRRAQGLVLDHSVRENLLLALLGQISRGPMLNVVAGKALSSAMIKKFAVTAAHPDKPVRLLSGGNQQKVVLAKWLGTDPDVLILDEPTAGVDIGTKSEILDMVRGLATDGKAVIIISSEYPELLAVSDRVLILRDGSVTRNLLRSEIADEETLQLAVQGVRQ